MSKKTLQRLAFLIILILSLGVIVGCGGNSNSSEQGKVVVSSKDYNENIILGEMIAQVIEAKTDLQVERKLNLGATLIPFTALKKGDIDIYTEYTGTALIAVLKHEVMDDPDEVYDLVQKEYNEQFNIKWMQPFGFNNIYATAVRQETAEELNLEKISDLTPYSSNMVFGLEQEYLNRKDGYPGLLKIYGFKFKDEKAMDYSLKYAAIAQKEVDVINAYSTDGELITYNLKILEDDKNYNPPYYAAPIVRMDTLEKYPELEGVLNLLGGQIDEEAMQQLNYQVKEKGEKTEEVVKSFLQEKGII